MAVVTTDVLLPDFRSAAAARHRRWRGIKDRFTGWVMAVGGISVILAVVLIAFYLVYVVLPLFRPARISESTEFALPGGTDLASLYYALEEPIRPRSITRWRSSGKSDCASLRPVR